MHTNSLETRPRVLVAMDRSDASARAFTHALGICRRSGALLTIVHAIPPSEPLSWHATERASWLRALRAEAATAGIRVRSTEQAGDPVEIILAHANAHGYDLVVIGTHQRTGLERLRAGSVAERVAARTDCPVLVVPASSEAVRPGSYERVLRATRLGHGSGPATAYALSLAAAGAERVTLVHAVQPSAPDWALAFGVPRIAPDASPAPATTAWQALNEEVGTASYRGLVHGRVLVGQAVEAVQAAAESGRVDLVVLGRPRGPFAEWWTGGRFTSRLLRRLSSPVLVVPGAAATERNPMSQAAGARRHASGVVRRHASSQTPPEALRLKPAA